MRTLTILLKYMIGMEIFCLLEKYTVYPTTLCNFWENFSGHFARLTCNHSYGYAHGLIFHGANRTCDSLKSPQNSAFSGNMQVSGLGAFARANKITVYSGSDTRAYPGTLNLPDFGQALPYKRLQPRIARGLVYWLRLKPLPRTNLYASASLRSNIDVVCHTVHYPDNESERRQSSSSATLPDSSSS